MSSGGPTTTRRASLSLSFPGAGVFLFWQLGVLHGLAQRYEMSRIPLLGSSSGAVATALAASGTCLKTAATRGTELFHEFGIGNRPLGLVGVLGRLLGSWLHDTLPLDAAARCSQGRATLLVTTLPLLRTRPISEFSSRAELIRAVMASAHIPLVLDWRLFVRCQGSACIDGGLWWLLQKSLQEYQHQSAMQTLLIKPCEDPGLAKLHSMRHTILARPALGEWVSEMWGRGLEHADRLSELHGQALAPFVLADMMEQRALSRQAQLILPRDICGGGGDLLTGSYQNEGPAGPLRDLPGQLTELAQQAVLPGVQPLAAASQPLS